MDQWQAWYSGSTFTLPFTQKAVEANGTHRVILQPAK
jgi:penicillin amidase